MVNQYETVFILNPVLSEAQVKETVEKFKKIITDNDGEVIHEENWGLRKLAYPVQKKSTGFYNLLQFKVEGEFISKIEIQFKREERIMRFLVTRMDKYAIQYSEKKRSMKQAKEKEK
ncbi:MAG: 30S ribosomal protein S6 [Bacteroidales bacterium]|nr:30S ribosomal protein S6 [Bacteroidales bacterium]